MSGKLASGHTYDAMEAKEREQYMKDFTGPLNDVIIVTPGGWVYPKIFPLFKERILNFKVGLIYIRHCGFNVAVFLFDIN